MIVGWWWQRQISQFDAGVYLVVSLSCIFSWIVFLTGPSRPLFYIFSSFQTNITIFTTNKCDNCPYSIRWWDSNPQPLDHESPPIATKPGIPPFSWIFCTIFLRSHWSKMLQCWIESGSIGIDYGLSGNYLSCMLLPASFHIVVQMTLR